MRETIPDPQAEATFLASKLDWSEVDTHSGTLALYRELLRLRREDPVLSVNDRRSMDAFAPTAQVVVLHRWVGDEHRVVVANVGQAVAMPREWLAPVDGGPHDGWELVLSTDESRFGGEGRAPRVDAETGNLSLPPRTAAIFAFTSGL
jgi:maltooligosyltrehalose trehalohydrolase